MSGMTTTKRPAAERAAERFRTDTADHVMEVALDQGLYRHLRFRKPGTGFDSHPKRHPEPSPAPTILSKSFAIGMRPLSAYGHCIPPSLEPIVSTICQGFERSDNFPRGHFVPAGKVAQ